MTDSGPAIPLAVFMTASGHGGGRCSPLSAGGMGSAAGEPDVRCGRVYGRLLSPSLPLFLKCGCSVSSLLAYSTCTYDLAQPPIYPTLITNIFPSECTHSRCLEVRLAVTHRQSRYLSPHSPILVLSAPWMVASSRPRYFRPFTQFFFDHRLTARLDYLGLRFGLLLCV